MKNKISNIHTLLFWIGIQKYLTQFFLCRLMHHPTSPGVQALDVVVQNIWLQLQTMTIFDQQTVLDSLQQMHQAHQQDSAESTWGWKFNTSGRVVDRDSTGPTRWWRWSANDRNYRSKYKHPKRYDLCNPSASFNADMDSAFKVRTVGVDSADLFLHYRIFFF